jgi:hypothetical protein
MVRRTHLLLLLLTLVLAALYRFPGVMWGFGIEEGSYFQLHPDENESCYRAAMRGAAWLHDPRNYLEPGMQANCCLLGSLARRFTGRRPNQREVVLMGRLSSVVAGLASIVAVYGVGAQLSGPLGGLLAAFFVTTCGLHLAESFWARGQIQNVLFFFTSVFFAQRSRDGRAGAWLGAAGAAGGGAIAMRLSLSLLPMLFCAAVSRPQRLRNILCAAAGTVTGFALVSGFSWGPTELQKYLVNQGSTLHLASMPASVAQHALAIAVFTLAGCGLAVFVSGGAGLAGLACRGRRWWSEAGAFPLWRKMVDLLGTKWALLLVPGSVQLSLIAITRLLEPRYVDLLVPILALLAGDFWARQLQGGRRTAMLLLVAALAYQGVYAAGVLERFSHDCRARYARELPSLVPPDAAFALTGYVPDVGHRKGKLVPIQDAEVFAASDIQSLRYLRQSSGTLFSAAPTSCSEIFNCESEWHREFYQRLFAGADDRFRLIRVFEAPAWTPEVRFYRLLYGSSWLFTGDIRVYRRRDAASRVPAPAAAAIAS